MKDYRRRTGKKVTYESLAQQIGLSRSTLAFLGSRSTYNTTLSTIEKVCRALECTPGDLLELIDEPEATNEDR